MSDNKNENTILEITRVIVQNWRLFLVGASVFAIFALLCSHLIPLKYTATAMFESRTDTSVDFSGPSKHKSFNSEKLTLRQELACPKALQKAIKQAGIEYDSQEQLESMARNFSNRIKIRWKVRSERIDLVEVEFSHQNPKIAETIPNILIANYMQAVSKKIISQLQISKDFIQKQAQQAEKQTTELKKKEIAFLAKYGLALGNKPGIIRDKIEHIEIEISSLKRQRKITENKIDRFKQAITSWKTRALYEQKKELQQQIDKAFVNEHMSENHPKIRTLRNRIEQIDKKIQDAQNTTDPDNYECDYQTSGNLVIELATAESEAETVGREMEQLKKQLFRYENVLTNLTPVLDKYSEIKEQMQNTVQNSRNWQARLTDVNTTLDAELANRRTLLDTVQLAKSSSRPLFPRLWTVLSFALAGGLGFGYVLSFGANSLNHSIGNPKEITRKFDVPVLGMIDKIETPAQKTIRTIKHRTFSLIMFLVLLCGLVLSAGSVVLRLKYPSRYQKIVTLVATADHEIQENRQGDSHGY